MGPTRLPAWLYPVILSLMICIVSCLSPSPAPTGRIGSISVFNADTGGALEGLLAGGDLFGYMVASAGDIDGDGTDDFVACAYGGGAVYVVFLQANLTARSVAKLSAASAGLDPADFPSNGRPGMGLSTMSQPRGPDPSLRRLLVGVPFSSGGGSLLVARMHVNGSVA